VAYIRKFKTASGATGVQVCYKEHSRVVKTVHVGSANSPEGLEKLLVKAQKIIDEGKRSLFNLSDF
jgi:putative transposase